MKIKKASLKDIQESLSIAKELKDWFNSDAIKNMELDFRFNHLIVAKENNIVLGFLCYSSKEGSLHINWIGVKKDKQGLGIGTELLKYIEQEGKKNGFKCIEVETLTDEEDYIPYKKTRSFYNKMGFKKVYELPERRKDWDIQILMEKEI